MPPMSGVAAAGVVLHLALGGAVGDADDDVLGGVVGQAGGVDLEVAEGAAVAGAAGGVGQVAVQQLVALEARGVGDAVDRVQDRVHLELVGRDLVAAEAAGVGASGRPGW